MTTYYKKRLHWDSRKRLTKKKRSNNCKTTGNYKTHHTATIQASVNNKNKQIKTKNKYSFNLSAGRFVDSK